MSVKTYNEIAMVKLFYCTFTPSYSGYSRRISFIQWVDCWRNREGKR